MFYKKKLKKIIFLLRYLTTKQQPPLQQNNYLPINMAASKTIMTSFMNFANDMKRETIADVIKTLDSKELLTDDIKEVLDTLIGAVKANKKVKKPPQKRFSGYHLFMKEHRVVIKEQNPGIKPQELTTIVSKAWKDVSEEEKEKLNDRAKKMKEEYLASSASATDESEVEEEVEVKEKKQKAPPKKKAEKKEKAPPKKKAEKKKPPPPPAESDEEEAMDEPVIEDADSDIDL
jgi:hypothetical protein